MSWFKVADHLAQGAAGPRITLFGVPARRAPFMRVLGHMQLSKRMRWVGAGRHKPVRLLAAHPVKIRGVGASLVCVSVLA